MPDRIIVAGAVFLTTALMFVVAPVSPASAQSYDCARAAMPAEVAVCNSFTLSGLDAEMSGLYNRIVAYAT